MLPDEQFVELLELIKAGIISEEGKLLLLEAILGSEVAPWILNEDLRLLKDIWISLMISHLNEEGIDNPSHMAADNVTRILYGEEAAANYRRRVDAQENRYFFNYIDFVELLGFVKYKCNLDWECDEDHGECAVLGCICPAWCLPYRHEYIGPTFRQPQPGSHRIDYSICFHHSEIFRNEDSLIPISIQFKPGTGTQIY
jgi:hypothetical protein